MLENVKSYEKRLHIFVLLRTMQLFTALSQLNLYIYNHKSMSKINYVNRL